MSHVRSVTYCRHVMQLFDLIAAATETGFAIASVRPHAIAPEPTLAVDFRPAINGNDLVARNR